MRNSFLSLFAALLCVLNTLQAQNYIDTVYSIQSISNLQYGTATAFAGQPTNLFLDVSFPINAPLPECGRPLVLIIHGGAFIAGSKDDAGIVALRTDFAKRGYIAASISYRLGFFQTDLNLNCNIPNWNCLNAADEAEWIRAWYRGVQDTRGALRFLLNQSKAFPIDASRICVLGESAGGFIAMGMAYLDQESEKPMFCEAQPQVALPNSVYYTPCIDPASWDIPINLMNTNRPDLGSIHGNLNLDAPPYTILAVGNMFGGMIKDLFSEYVSPMPDLYTFHQPNDLIVPFGYSRILAGFSDCAVGTGCVSMISRPFIYGSSAINQLRDTVSIPESDKPFIQFDQTNNTANCLQQVLDPSVGGHQYDSYWLRTTNAASFFASRILAQGCTPTGIETRNETQTFTAYLDQTDLIVSQLRGKGQLSLYDLQGRCIMSLSVSQGSVRLPVSGNSPGVYLIKYSQENHIQTQKVVLAY
ncbi:MAG: alpha/beta hydrolase fold domain-containing protein [Bacteroidia bacterium]